MLQGYTAFSLQKCFALFFRNIPINLRIRCVLSNPRQHNAFGSYYNNPTPAFQNNQFQHSKENDKNTNLLRETRVQRRSRQQSQRENPKHPAGRAAAVSAPPRIRFVKVKHCTEKCTRANRWMLPTAGRRRAALRRGPGHRVTRLSRRREPRYLVPPTSTPTTQMLGCERCSVALALRPRESISRIKRLLKQRESKTDPLQL